MQGMKVAGLCFQHKTHVGPGNIYTCGIYQYIYIYNIDPISAICTTADLWQFYFL